MAPVWQRLDDIWDQAQALDTAAFQRFSPHPVLIAGEVRSGSLAHRDLKGSNDTMLHMSESGEVGEAGEKSVGRYTLVRRTVSDDYSEWITLGRTRISDIMINDYTVSKQHARLRISALEQGCVVEDVGSTNGTFIAGARITPHAEVLLKSSQTIQFGRYTFTYLVPADFQLFLQISRMVG